MLWIVRIKKRRLVKNTIINGYMFRNCQNLEKIVIQPHITSIGTYSFMSCIRLSKVIIEGRMSAIQTTAFNGCANLKDIYVPWSEGEVANAPWGATNATIHYDCTSEQLEELANS